jgi:hypothetical protein
LRTPASSEPKNNHPFLLCRARHNKKNWLFVGEAQAGDRGAVLYMIIESCRRRGIDPYGYLRDVLSRLPNMTNRQVPDVTPAAWAKARTDLIQLKAAS